MPYELQSAEQRYYIRLNGTAAHAASREMDLLLGQLVTRGGADGAVLYRFDAVAEELHAVAIQARVSPKIPELGVTLSAGATAWLKKSAETLQVSPASDIPFENLPEVFQYGYQRLLTLGRRSADSFDRQALEGAEPVASIVAALLERDALQNAMRERKLVERAKGLLQKKERISEENAYLLLRKVSRYRRIPMAEVAREIIQRNAIQSTPLRKTA